MALLDGVDEVPAPPPAPPGEPAFEVRLARLIERAAWRVLTRGLFLVLGLALTIWLLIRLQGLVIQLLLAVILAAGMTPVVNRMAQRQWLGIGGRAFTPPRAFVVLLLYLALAGSIGLVGAVVAPPLAGEAEDLVRHLPAYAADFQAWAAALPARYPFLPAFDTGQGLSSQLQASASQVAAVLSQAVVVVRLVLGVLSGAVHGIFVLILALYLTVDSGRLVRYVLGFLPADRQEQAAGVAQRIGERLGGWVRGQILLSAIIGGITLAGLWLLGIRYAVLLALIAAVGETVPMVGPFVSAVPAVIVAFFQSPLQGVLTLGLYVLIQQLENSVVVPKVMERAVALHPLVVIVALLAGAELLGVTGAILAMPVAATLAVVLDEIRRERQARLEQLGVHVEDQPSLLTSPKAAGDETHDLPAPAPHRPSTA